MTDRLVDECGIRVSSTPPRSTRPAFNRLPGLVDILCSDLEYLPASPALHSAENARIRLGTGQKGCVRARCAALHCWTKDEKSLYAPASERHLRRRNILPTQPSLSRTDATAKDADWAGLDRIHDGV